MLAQPSPTNERRAERLYAILIRDQSQRPWYRIGPPHPSITVTDIPLLEHISDTPSIESETKHVSNDGQEPTH